MDWMTRMNEAVAYLEESLADEVDLGRVAKIANCSLYHFQRIFACMAGVTLAEYVRRRRLTLAGFDLQASDDKIIDIALKYGYDSPTAFSRAFAALHGKSPTEARKAGESLVAFPPISFQITVKGVAAMNYKIEEKEAFRIVGAKRSFKGEMGESMIAVPQFWMETAHAGSIPRMMALMDSEPFGVLGVSVGDWSAGAQSEFDYYIAVSSKQPLPDGMAEYQVPACTWAVFECVGPLPAALQALQQRIVTEWLPTSGYEYAAAPDIELYGDGDQQAADYKCWAWLPVQKPQG